jgi:hypothetical protein
MRQIRAGSAHAFAYAVEHRLIASIRWHSGTGRVAVHRSRRVTIVRSATRHATRLRRVVEDACVTVGVAGRRIAGAGLRAVILAVADRLRVVTVGERWMSAVLIAVRLDADAVAQANAHEATTLHDGR